MRCRIYTSSPVSSYNTTLIICIGDFLLDRLSGVTLSCAVSTHASIAYWVNDQKRVLFIVFYYGACCAFILLLIVSSTLGKSASPTFGNDVAMNLGDC